MPEELVKLLARHPAGHADAFDEFQFLDGRGDCGVMESADSGDDQPELGMLAAHLGEGAEQRHQPFVRMRGGGTENVGLDGGILPFAGDLEELRIGRIRHDADLRRIQPVEVQQVGTGGLGGGHEDARAVRRGPQAEAPEGQVERAEVLRVALVLQVVKRGDLGTAAGAGRGR